MNLLKSVIEDDHSGRGEDKEEPRRTKDELFRRRKHVETEGDFILVAFALEPPEDARGVDREYQDREEEGHGEEVEVRCLRCRGGGLGGGHCEVALGDAEGAATVDCAW